jgi:glycosyltransferase involved in cell wall biosynthesis
MKPIFRWLRANLRLAEFDGILDPEALGRAYANMDLFVFPSRTFGNVVQEALASGVPAIVTDRGGPMAIVEHGTTGLVASRRAHSRKLGTTSWRRSIALTPPACSQPR